jgi:maleate cis-trans isomerase
MYGTRARIGYTCPIFLAEIFPYDFYRIVPDGVSLVMATASVWQLTTEEMQLSAQQGMRAAEEMARGGVNVVVLGGVPVGFMAGFASTGELVRHMAERCGVPVTASQLCQNHALQALEAQNVVALRHGDAHKDRLLQEVEELGCTIVGIGGTGHEAYGSPLPAEQTLALARDLLRAHPDADTLYCPSPHWPMVANIETLEQEFPNVTVVTAGQAIVWEALRLSGITDSISGYGRLLREL